MKSPPMNKTSTLPLSAKIIAWIARLWSIFVTAFFLLDILFSDPGGAGSSQVGNNIMLVLTGLALLGLFIAWRWNGFGGLFTLAALFLQEIFWGIFRGDWFTGLILMMLIGPPAVLFLIARGIGKETKKGQVQQGR